MSQSNTKEGDLLIAANEDLSLLADVLVAPYNSAGQLVVTRPAANNDPAVYLLVYGAAAGSPAGFSPSLGLSRMSGENGASYGALIPVKSGISPARAFA